MAELNSSPRKSSGKRTTKRVPLRVDLTAMVDLAFLLITFFMLTTSLIKPRVMPVAMPANVRAEAVPESGTMTICLGKNNKALWYLGMGEKPLTTPALVNYGAEMRTAILQTGKKVFAASGKSLMVILKPADHSVYDNLVDALDEINLANVQSYAIAKISPADIGLLKQKDIY